MTRTTRPRTITSEQGQQNREQEAPRGVLFFMSTKKTGLQTALEAINTQYGKGTIAQLKDGSAWKQNIESISTGSIGVDAAIGVGGLPVGRLVEVYGSESCVDGDAFIRYEILDATGKAINRKGGTISRLWERFHGASLGGDRRGRARRDASATFTAPAINEQGRVIHNQITDVVHIGQAETYRITTTCGKSLVATSDHRFYTGASYVRLGDLQVGDTVFVHRNVPYKGRNSDRVHRNYLFVKNHGVAGRKDVESVINRYTGETKVYSYARVARARAVVEAHMNNMSFAEYVERLNSDDISGLRFLSRDEHVHHINENELDDDLSNLVVMSAAKHGKQHALERHNNLRFVAVPATILRIEPVGMRDVFDLKMADPHRNYIVEGFVTHNSGKTTLCLHTIADAQAQGYVCAFIDAEHALDLRYAKSLGVFTSELVLTQPDHGEQALDILRQLVDSGEVKLIVVDSVAALVPKAELDGDIGDSHMGLQARMMSQTMRMISGLVSRKGCTVIFINQTRQKIGVVWGCLHADTLVNFVDGRSLPIREVVDNRISGDVWCVNEQTGEFEAKPIIDWHDNGLVRSREDFIHVQTQSIDGRGRFGVTVTPDHKILTRWNGWMAARDIEVGTELVSKYTSHLSGIAGDFLAGCLVGDSSIAVRHRGTGSLVFQDNVDHDYVMWKVLKLSNMFEFTQRTIALRGKIGVRYDSEYTYEFSKLVRDGEHRNPLVFLEKRFSWLGMAIWIMDDGWYSHNEGRHQRYRISVKRMRGTSELVAIVRKLNDLGLSCSCTASGNITFTGPASGRIAENICTFVPPCMARKLPEAYVGRYKEFSLTPEPIVVRDYVPVTEVRYASKRQLRQKGKYDITVEDHHNYMAGGYQNGVVVHNSPTTTTGGNALKFYASVRLEVTRLGKLKGDGDESKPTGSRTRVKVVKNKVGPPFNEAEYDLIYGRGICRPTECIELGVELKIIDKAGAWLKWPAMNVSWQGKPRAVAALLADSTLLARLEADVRAGLANASAPIIAQSDSMVPDPAPAGSSMPKVDISPEAVASAFANHAPFVPAGTSVMVPLGSPSTATEHQPAPVGDTPRRRRTTSEGGAA